MDKKKIVIGITGASGSIYAKSILDKLLVLEEYVEVALLISDNAKTVWQYELNEPFTNYPFKIYDKNDFNAPFASGSSTFEAMIIIPCSMGTMGRIASGISNDLMTRTADVMLKERRKLLLVVRESPYNLIHIKNMETITLSGGVIFPASPGFYFKQKEIYEVVSDFTNKILHHIGLKQNMKFWNEK